VSGWTPDSCSRLAEVAGETLRPGGLELTEQLLGFADFQAGSRILDAGCGMGATLRYMINSRGLDAVGVDSSAAMIVAAKSRSQEAPLVCAELESLPFAASGFDGIICECVLSQTAVATVLAEFKRVLRVGGLLLLSDLYRRPASRNPGGYLVPDGELATREHTESMLVQTGFTIEHWEDRTHDLRQLLIQLIMAPGSTGENFSGRFEDGCLFNDAKTGINRRDVGYYLLAARKTAC